MSHGYVSVSCNHCSDPACVKVCLTKAHAKHDDKGGLVLIDQSKCIGCGMCAKACPQRALDFGYVDDLKAKYGEGAHIEPLPSPAVTKPNLVVRHGKVGKEVR